jgi:hypothetical protein
MYSQMLLGTDRYNTKWCTVLASARRNFFRNSETAVVQKPSLKRKGGPRAIGVVLGDMRRRGGDGFKRGSEAVLVVIPIL